MPLDKLIQDASGHEQKFGKCPSVCKTEPVTNYIVSVNSMLITY